MVMDMMGMKRWDRRMGLMKNEFNGETVCMKGTWCREINGFIGLGVKMGLWVTKEIGSIAEPATGSGQNDDFQLQILQGRKYQISGRFIVPFMLPNTGC